MFVCFFFSACVDLDLCVDFVLRIWKSNLLFAAFGQNAHFWSMYL